MTEKDKTGKELERRVADAYRKMGAWKVEHDIQLAGNQIDVYVELGTADRGLHRIAVEAKDWTSTVGIDVVNNFALRVRLLRDKGKIDRGVIVSASGFSKEARDAAREYDIRLLEPADLDAMVARTEAPVQPLAQVTLLLDGISSFGTLERQSLVGVLANALDLEQEQIRVLRVESGSVRVTLELPADAATKLARMIESEQLDLTLVFRQMAASEYHITVTDSQGVVIGDHAQVIQHFGSSITSQWSQADLLRLQHLVDNIRQDLTLLKDYEDALRYEDDPRRRARYRQEIKQLQSSAASYQQEYSALQAKVEGEPSQRLQDVGAQLQAMNTKLDTLLAGQLAVRDDLGNLRAVVLSRFDASEQAIISTIVERLDQSQLATTQAVLDAIEAERVPETELQETLAAVQRALAGLRQRGVAPTDLALVSEAEHMSEVVNAPKLDVKHKLKITAPIIPLILAYEGEITLGSRLDLEVAWKRLVARMLNGKTTR